MNANLLLRLGLSIQTDLTRVCPCFGPENNQATMHILVTTLLVIVTLNQPALAQEATEGKSGGFVFAKGLFGTFTADNIDKPSFGAAAVSAVSSILKNRLGATGRETLVPAKHKNKLVEDNKGHKHVRFEQTYEGIPVVDAALVMHVDENDKIYALNGEFVAADSVDTKEVYSCEQAFANTLSDPRFQSDPVWLTDCGTVKIVLDKYGTAHKTWERMIGYKPETRPYQKTLLYASVVTRELVAIRPKIFGALSLNTQDCQNGYEDQCKIISKSPNLINTGDKAVDSAHKFARATYNFYFNNFGRDSVDDAGMTLISKVHVGVELNNAFWDGSR